MPPRAWRAASSRWRRRPTWCGARGWRHERRGAGRHRGAGRAGGDRALPARRGGLHPRRRALPVGDARRQPQRGVRARRAGRRGGGGRRPAAGRDGPARRLHDVQHVGVREPPPRRGRRGPARRRQPAGQPGPRARGGLARSRDRLGALSEEGLKLTAYFGERDRAGERHVADALVDVFAAHELRASVLLRGAGGFGAGHGLHTDRLLTLSEDLPVTAVAVDTSARITGALPDVERLGVDGLVTLERARLLSGRLDGAPAEAAHEAKLTVYVGRQERA